MNRKAKYLYSVFYLTALIALSGCSAKISVQAKSDGSSDVQFSASVGQAISSTIASLSSSLSGSRYSGGSQNLFSAPAIKQAFDDTDFTNVTVTTPAPDTLNVSASIPDASRQTHATGGIKASDVISCTQGRLSLQFSPSSLKKLSADLPAETKSCLDLLMAPVFTGEKMSRQEYRMLLAAVYGDQIASEIDGAQISISLASPAGKKISSTNLPASAKVTSSTATFNMPLMELLTLTESKSYSINWK